MPGHADMAIRKRAPGGMPVMERQRSIWVARNVECTVAFEGFRGHTKLRPTRYGCMWVAMATSVARRDTRFGLLADKRVHRADVTFG